MRAATAMSWVMAVSCVMALPGAMAEEPDRQPVFVGYLYGQPRDVDFSFYTHLCHAFQTAGADGVLNRERSVPSRSLTADAHKASVRVLLSLGGWGWDKQFAAIVADPEVEARYVAAVLAMIDEFDYDGVDLDWEYPNTADEVAGFETLVRHLRDGLDAIGKRKGRRMEVTMAAAANPGTLRWLNTNFLLETMDWVNVMTYDYSGIWSRHAMHQSPLHASSRPPGAASPLSCEATINFLINDRKIPANRLAMGIPLYGRGFAVARPYDPTEGAPKIRLPQGNYHNLQPLLAQGWTRQWDDETQTPWLIAPEGKAVIGYDDAESVAIKAKWAKQKGLRGVFFWQIAADRMPDGSNPLQLAAFEVMGNKMNP